MRPVLDDVAARLITRMQLAREVDAVLAAVGVCGLFRPGLNSAPGGLAWSRPQRFATKERFGATCGAGVHDATACGRDDRSDPRECSRKRWDFPRKPPAPRQTSFLVPASC